MNDLINGTFELCGSLFILTSIIKLHKQKYVSGVSWVHIGYFSAWGFWNLYYYPSIEQWASFLGGIAIVAANTYYLGQLFYYRNRNRND